MSDLKPCPFCGSPAMHYPDGEHEGYQIMCSGDNGQDDNCYLRRYAYETEEESVIAWNKRANPTT